MINRDELLNIPVESKPNKPLNWFERWYMKRIMKMLVKARKKGESQISIYSWNPTHNMQEHLRKMGYNVFDGNYDSQGGHDTIISFINEMEGYEGVEV